MSDSFDRIRQILDARAKLVERLLKAHEHMDRARSLAIVTSWMSVEDLETMVKSQER